MDRQSVNSSNISSIGYDPATKTLEVEFHGGEVYEYYDVPESVYDDLMAAASHGSYLARYIKNVYSYRRIR